MGHAFSCSFIPSFLLLLGLNYFMTLLSWKGSWLSQSGRVFLTSVFTLQLWLSEQFSPSSIFPRLISSDKNVMSCDRTEEKGRACKTISSKSCLRVAFFLPCQRVAIVARFWIKPCGWIILFVRLSNMWYIWMNGNCFGSNNNNDRELIPTYLGYNRFIFEKCC